MRPATPVSVIITCCFNDKYRKCNDDSNRKIYLKRCLLEITVLIQPIELFSLFTAMNGNFVCKAKKTIIGS